MTSRSVFSGRSDAVSYQETCLHLAFTAIVRRCSSSPALISDSVTLSYRDLDHEAGRLASLLRDRDAGPGKVVGLLGTPSVESVIGLLAILKTGAAYVPLEPEHPADYQRAVLDRVGAAVLVHESLPGQARPNVHWQCETLDTAARRAVSGEQVYANHAGSPDDLCCVMFTSGTTGVPRGVRTSHRACLSRAVSLFSWLPPKDGERACLKASLTVVDSVREIFGSLLAGIPVVVPETGAQRDPLTLARAIHCHHVTRVLLVPSLLRTMLDLENDEAPRLRGVRCWILSGDTTDPGLVELARNVTPSTAVFNLYGATEAPGTLADLTGWQPGTAIGVGQPLPDVEVLVLGDDGTPVAPGTVGEVHLGGGGLADGYLGAPRETAARFVLVDSRRMFRTGDLGQLDSSGVLRLLGRADRQVKIRGHRIETQDVEYWLRRRPEVQDAAVGLNPARDELVAYLVADPAIDVSKVRRGLLEVLPGHMVPATYLRVTTLPYGNSGKLDRLALDEWPAERLPPSPYVPPRGPVEEQAAAVWRDVLGVERVGRDDGFFDLGGNSLTAAHALARIRQRTGRDVSMRTLFDHSTLRDFAVAFGEAHQTAVAPISPLAHGEATPASPAQRRLWFMEQRVPGTAAYHITSAFRLHGTVDPVAFDAALRVVVNRQEALRTVFEVRSGEPFQRISGTTSPSPLVTCDLTHLAEDEADAEWMRTFKDAAGTPFDLERGPLFRFHLFILGERHHVFTLVVHHSVFDGWSEQILLDEISQAYQGILDGTLPIRYRDYAGPIRYRDYARWQHDSLTGDSIKPHVDFWRAALTGAEPVIDLPVDRPWPATPTFSGGSIECALGSALSDGVRQLSRERGVTLFSTMLSAFAVTLFQYAGQRDITVGTPSSGRTTEALERIIGFFVNTLPIRIKATDDPSFERLIYRVEEARLDAYAHESLPFDAVVAGLMPDRDQSRNPVFQTWFELAGAALPLRIPGVKANRCGRGVDAARFDLELQLTDGPDGIEGALIYNADVLDRETAAGVVGLLHTVTNRLVADPEARLSRIDPLTLGERRLLVSEWSGARASTTAPWESLVEHFERVAARKPGATALVFHGRSLTYRQLNEAANRLAHRLHGTPGNDADVIGIFLPRGLDLVAAILGVLKAGRGYLPLDPTLPPERLAHMLAEASASLVVVTDPAAGYLAATVEHVPFAVDELAPSPSHNPGIRTGPRDLGYVLYTSGSTGRPKGSECHRGRWSTSSPGRCRRAGSPVEPPSSRRSASMCPSRTRSPLCSPAVSCSFWTRTNGTILGCSSMPSGRSARPASSSRRWSSGKSPGHGQRDALRRAPCEKWSAPGNRSSSMPRPNGSYGRPAWSVCSTTTGRPRLMWPPGTGSISATSHCPPSFPLDDRSATRSSTCSTATGDRYRSASLGSCTSAAMSSPTAMLAGRTSPVSNSLRIRS